MSGISLEFGTNTIQVFRYERFDFRIPNPFTSGGTLQVGGNIPSSYFLNLGLDTAVKFSSTDASNNLGVGSAFFTVTATKDSTRLVSSNTVNINAGRFLDASRNPISNQFTFFKFEVIPTIRLVAPFAIETPIPSLTLPSGLILTRIDSNIFDIVGGPVVASGNLPYTVFGFETNGSKVVSSTFNIVVLNERIRPTLTGGTPIISNMRIGEAIEPRTITLGTPIAGPTTIRYTFPTFPDGIIVTGIDGVIPRSSPFDISNFDDPFYRMIIKGTPTLAGATSFRLQNADSNGLPFKVTATRISPLPRLTTDISLTLQFAPAVLFTKSDVSDIFVGIPVVPRTNFEAKTFFVTKEGIADISNIVSPNLRSDLSLIYVPGSSTAAVSGDNPTGPAETANYTIRAFNSNGLSGEISAQIRVVNDSITFTTLPADPCYTFILSRPLTLSTPGFYEPNIRFGARAASGCNVVLSAPGLAGTGLSLDSNGILGGIPSEILPLTTLTVTANAIGSSATASANIQFSILNDSFTFADVPASNLEFIQNILIKEVRFPVTTLSDRNVIGYSQTGLPAGLTINSAGVVSGTPLTASQTAGNVRITATTGFASGFRDFSYNITPDAVLLLSPVSTLTMVANEPIGPVQIQGVSYSGKIVSNYQFVDLSETYGLTIGSTNALLNGILDSGVPPEPVFPEDSNFQIKAFAGDVSGTLDVRFQTINPYAKRSFVTLQTVEIGETEELNITNVYFSDNFSNWSLVNTYSPITDFHVRYTNVNSNEVNYLVWQNPPGILRYTNGPDFTQVENSNTLRAFTTDGSGTWWAVANAAIVLNEDPVYYEPFYQFEGNIAKSVNNGVTWTNLSQIPSTPDAYSQLPLYSPRVIEGDAITFTSHPSRTLGVSLRYKDNVLLLGGIYREIGGGLNIAAVATSALMRSDDEGSTWTSPTYFIEVAGFNLDDENVWLAYGSEFYKTDVFYDAPEGESVTIKYSSDAGLTWSNATGAADYITHDITYGNGVWIATGIGGVASGNFKPDARFSSNGSNWTVIDLSTNALFPNFFPSTIPKPPIGIGPFMFNEGAWNGFVTRRLNVNDANSDLRTELYRHTPGTSLAVASNWTAVNLSSSFPDIAAADFTSQSNTRLFLGYTPNNLMKQSGDPIPFLTFTTGIGPTFTSPSTTSYVQFQYMTISPIQISATGVGRVYFFATASDFPPGLSFDPITARITGAPVQLGTDSVTIFAKDDNGTSQFILQFTTIIPRIIRKQNGAAAYTSLVRQYTEVAAAQSARDARALPSEMRTLGEFMSPVPPPVVTPSNCPC